MAEHENAARLRLAYDAFGSGDLEKLNEFIPQHAVWHVTGNSQFSGDYEGRDAIYGYFGKLLEITGGTFKATLVHALGDDTHGVAIQRTTATVGGKDLVSTDILVDRVEGGEAVETWVYLENDRLLDGLPS